MRRAPRTALSPLLKRLKIYFDVLKRTTSGYLYVVDLQNKVAMTSPNIVRDFSIPAETMGFSDFRQAWQEIMHPMEREKVMKVFDDVLQGRTKEGCIEVRARTRKGDYEWIECRCAAALDREGKRMPLRDF